jgi:hypothetical protein
MQARPITLTADERQGLEAVVRRHKSGQQVVTRARIVLVAGEGRSISATV